MNNHLDRTLSVLLTIFCLVSCVDQMHAPETDSPEVLTSYTAYMEGTDVKSVLDGNVSLWKGQEDIHVIGRNNSGKFSASVDGQSPSATFNYAGSGSWNEKEVLAIYPYGAGNHSGDLGNKTVSNVNIPCYIFQSRHDEVVSMKSVKFMN